MSTTKSYTALELAQMNHVEGEAVIKTQQALLGGYGFGVLEKQLQDAIAEESKAIDLHSTEFKNHNIKAFKFAIQLGARVREGEKAEYGKAIDYSIELNNPVFQQGIREHNLELAKQYLNNTNLLKGSSSLGADFERLLSAAANLIKNRNRANLNWLNNTFKKEKAVWQANKSVDPAQDLAIVEENIRLFNQEREAVAKIRLQQIKQREAEAAATDKKA